MDKTLNDGQEEEKNEKKRGRMKTNGQFSLSALEEECKKGELDGYEKLFL